MSVKETTDQEDKESRRRPPSNKRTFSSEMGGAHFYPDLPKKPLVEILGMEWKVVDVSIVEGFTSSFGESDFALLLIEDEDGHQFTTLCGGEVVLKKLRKAKEKKLLPLYGAITKPGHYYDIL